MLRRSGADHDHPRQPSRPLKDTAKDNPKDNPKNNPKDIPKEIT